MDCRRQLIALDKVCSVTSRKQLLHLSYSDIRKIAAVRAAERLQVRLKQQAKIIPQGKLALNSTQKNSLLPNINNADIKIVNDSWTFVLKDIDYHGVRLFIRCLEKEPCQLLDKFPKLPVCSRCKSYQHLRNDPTAIRYSRSLLLHITDIVTNLRNNAALDWFIQAKFCLLREAGVKKELVESCMEELVAYLAKCQPSKWSPEAATVWTTVATALISLGFHKLDLVPVGVNKVDSTSTYIFGAPQSEDSV